MKVDASVQNAIKEMLAIVQRLRKAYPKKRFTLDGRLVGDIGEVLVERAYDVELFETLRKYHDGKTPDGRLVQIKATMKRSLTFPAGHVPRYYLGIVIHEDGSFEEVFNGPGRIASKAIKNRRHPATNLHSISVSALKRLNATVRPQDRIPSRTCRQTGRHGS